MTPELISGTGRKRTHLRAANVTSILSKPVTHQIGGHLALDFCNTAGEHLAEQPKEMLSEWESFIRWATQVGFIAKESYIQVTRRPEPIEPVVQLREAIYRVGLAIVSNRAVSQRDLSMIRTQASGSRPDVTIHINRLAWRPDHSCASEQLRSALASEALSLFCSPKAMHIGICEGGMCGWLFLDESRGKRRRWCDMNDCGSRAKARRHYERQKGDK